MLHQLQLDPCDPPFSVLRELATDAQALILTLEEVNVTRKSLPIPTYRKEKKH